MSNMKCILSLCLITVNFFLCSCSAHYYNDRTNLDTVSTVSNMPIVEKYERTDLNSWLRRDFPLSGFSAEVPVKSFRIEDSISGAYIQLHPVRLIGARSDARCLVEIRFEMMSIDAYQDAIKAYTATENLSRHTKSVQYWRWYWKHHATNDRYDDPPYIYYRRDYLFADGTHIMLIEAEIIYGNTNYNEAELSQDIQAIEKIFNSVNCTKLYQ